MVVDGDYVVRLVEATSKQPFPERKAPDGRNCVEVEPGVEYYIQVQAKSASKDHIVKADFCVDGQDLGYTLNVNSTIVHNRGAWSRKNGMSIDTPLRFESLPSYSGSLPVSENPLGTITVKFWEAIEDGVVDHMKDFSSQLTPSAELGKTSCKKTVRSYEGTQETITRYGDNVISYKCGKLLKTITIHYGTILGLIHANVIPKPPFWEHARMKQKAQISTEMDHSLKNIKPTKFVREGIEELGIPRKEYEMFDLTCLSDTPDEDDCPTLTESGESDSSPKRKNIQRKKTKAKKSKRRRK